MEIVRDDEAASSTQRRSLLGTWIAAGDGTSWFPPWWRLCLLTVLEITSAHR
jgi:hypothetical protein